MCFQIKLTNQEDVIISDLGKFPGGFSWQPLNLGARFSCYFHILYASRSLQNSCVETLDYGKIFAHRKIESGRKSLVKKIKKSDWCWRSFTRFWTKKSPSNHNLPCMMSKTSFPFLYASTSFDTKTLSIASNRNFESLCRFVVLLLSTFSGFSIFAAGFPFLWQWVTFPGKHWSIVIDARRSRCPIGLRFQKAR